jgi:4-hydroxy-tetrahydrodipicolinate synthase
MTRSYIAKNAKIANIAKIQTPTSIGQLAASWQQFSWRAWQFQQPWQPIDASERNLSNFGNFGNSGKFGNASMSMNGIFAAVATPVRPDGGLDLATLDRLVDFLLGAGVDGICIGGATGEYPHFETAERIEVIERIAGRLQGRLLLTGVGASSMRRAIALGRAAFDAGSAAVLLPMPMFFRYEQQDLASFAAAVSRELAGPCLLYDLPDFTNGLLPATVLDLLRTEPFVVGIKDSSGCEDHLGEFAGARGEQLWTLLVGDDRLFARGLRAGWNGGVSGMAGFCPELLSGLYRSFRDGRHDEIVRFGGLLDELIARISVFPTPWGIRIGLAARGIDTGPLPLPLTPQRREQVEEFTQWLPGWLKANAIGRV